MNGDYLIMPRENFEPSYAPCPDCGGSGSVYSGHMDANMSSASESECPVCNGTGEKSCTNESNNFDKFMDSILIKETRIPPVGPESPNRERARRHQERPLGRIRYGVKQ